jgi:hypothetical protein
MHAYLKDTEEDDFNYDYYFEDEPEDIEEKLKSKLGSFERKILLSLDNVHHLKDECYNRFLKFFDECFKVKKL